MVIPSNEVAYPLSPYQSRKSTVTTSIIYNLWLLLSAACSCEAPGSVGGEHEHDDDVDTNEEQRASRRPCDPADRQPK